MKLYYHPISSYCLKTLLAFEEKQVEFEPEIVELMNPEKRQAYLKIYPLGKIPFLQLPDHDIPESSTIIEFLENEFPGQGTCLIPEDKVQARKTRFFDRMTDFYFSDPMTAVFFERMKSPESQNKNMIQKKLETLNIVYGMYNEHLKNRNWVMGDQFSMADCAMFPCVFFAPMVHPYKDFTHIVEYAGRVLNRKSAQKVLKDAGPYIEAFQKKN